MIAPFLQPDLEWDFRLERVHSINTSGHKYGLVYPGLGWVVWRTTELLPDDLVFHVSYLGGNMPTLALNFSRPGAQVLLQYYNFLRLGREGYYRVQKASQDVALYISGEIAEIDAVRAAQRRQRHPGLRVAAESRATPSNWDLYRPVRAAAASRLAGAVVPDAGRHRGHHRDARRGAQRACRWIWHASSSTTCSARWSSSTDSAARCRGRQPTTVPTFHH